MFNSVFVLLIIIIGCCPIAYSNPNPNFIHDNLTIREALDKATRQQTLTQRIAKVYLALNNNLYEPKFYQERDEAILVFQTQLDELKWYTPTEKIKTALDDVRNLWTEYRKVADWSINKKGAEKLLAQCDQMLQASNYLVSTYEEYAEQLGELYKTSEMADIVKLIKETGTQRMLTQRVMLFYLAAKQDIDKDNCIKKLETATKDFNQLIAKLAGAKINSPAIQKEVTETEKYWQALGNYLKYFKDDAVYVNSMLLLSDELTQKADKLFALYQDLGKKLSIGSSINVIAYQNMLTQRIAKSYVAITYNFSAAKYKRELIASIDLFEEQTKSMMQSAPTDEIKEALKVVETMWKNYRTIAMDWQDLDDIKVGKLLEKSHVIMASCDRVAQAIEDYAQTIPEYKAFYEKDGQTVNDKNNIAKQVNIVGSQRVYSQRIVVYFMMNALGKDSQLSQERLKECLTKFQDGYQLLSSSTLITTPISQALHTSHKEWDMIVEACTANQKTEIESVLSHSEHLFSVLDKLNGLYEDLMDELITQ